MHKWPKGIGSHHREDRHRDTFILSPHITYKVFNGFCKLLARKYLYPIKIVLLYSNTIMKANFGDC